MIGLLAIFGIVVLLIAVLLLRRRKSRLQGLDNASMHQATYSKRVYEVDKDPFVDRIEFHLRK